MSTQVIVFPDPVKAVISYLQARLVGIPDGSAEVSNRVPSTRPARFVRVSLAGGERLDLAHQQFRLLVECWDAAGEPQAYRLAARCAAELEAAARSPQPIAPLVWIAGEPDDFSVPVPFPDPLTTSPRFQFTAALTLNGSAL